MRRCRAACIGLALALRGAAMAADAPPVAAGGCVAGTDFERDGFTVRRARVVAPFAFLPWIRAEVEAADRLLAGLDGQPYRLADVRAKHAALERFGFAAIDMEQRVALRLSAVTATRCTGRQLDLEFFVLAPHLAPVRSGSFEAGRAEAASPERQAGADAAPGRARMQPRLAWRAGEQASAGVRATYLPNGASASAAPFDTLAFDGWRAHAAHEWSLSTSGRRDMGGGPFAQAQWRLDAAGSSLPAAQRRLGHDGVSASVFAVTRPLGEWALPLRLGAVLESGGHGSSLEASPGAGMRQDAVSLKAALGVTTRLDRQSLAASLALEAGGVAGGPRVDWVRHIVDLAHEGSWRLGNHRRLSLESRLTAGALRTPGAAPPGVRFYGGGREQPFLPGDDWQVRANPVIRSLGTNALAGNAGATGATRFAALNLTLAWPVRHMPLVPAELSADEGFQSLLNSQLDSAVSVVQTSYAAKDAHFARMVARLGDVQAALVALGSALDEARQARPAEPEAGFKACQRAIAGAQRRLKEARLAGDDGARYGSVLALLPQDEEENRLGRIRQDCVDGLNARLGDDGLARAAAAVGREQAALQGEFDAIDQAAASNAARREMATVQRVVHTLIDDLNLYALSPFLMLDAVRLGPAGVGAGSRAGLGGGLRLTLVDSVDFSVGYMVNLQRRAQEPRGAFMLTLQLKDLF